MSGHSKWSTIKRQKQAEDLKKGRIFSKLARQIRVAAASGTDPQTNPKLRLLLQKAKEVNMPKKNIENALKKGKEKERLEEILFEGYGPGGVAIMVQTATDNKNRTSAAIKKILERGGGRLGERGCVSYLFEPKGLIVLKPQGEAAEDLMLRVIDFGVLDVERAGEMVLVYTKPEELEATRKKLEEEGIEVESSELNLEPKTTVEVNDPKKAEQILSLVDKLEELDETLKVYASFNIPESVLEKLGGGKVG